MPKTPPAAAEQATITLRSKALVGGSMEFVARTRRRKRRFASGRRFKDLAVPFIVQFLRKAPPPVALLPISLIVSSARLLYHLPNNPLRRVAQDMSVVCRANGHDLSAKAIYRAYLDNTRATAELVRRLYRDGWESAIESVQFPAADVARIQSLVAQYGGVAVAVPHNIGSTFSGIRFAKAFSSVLVAKNPDSLERTRIALDFFERLGAKVLMVRDAKAMRISRGLIKLLRSGHVVAVTFDLLTGPEDGIATEAFGEPVWFPAWATRMPTTVGVPIVPSYVHSVGGQLQGAFGPAVVTDSAEEATAAVAAYFEQRVLEDPASWAFMADKRWRRVLAKAAARLSRRGPKSAAPGPQSGS